MDVWIGVLGFVLFLGFSIACYVCIRAIRRNSEIVIGSRSHHKFGNLEVIYANLGLIVLVVLVCFHMYTFVPGLAAFVLFVVLSTQVKSGLTEDGALIGTTFLQWEDMISYKFVNDENDSNIIILKIRADQRQYVLICNREDRFQIAKLLDENGVRKTLTMTEQNV